MNRIPTPLGDSTLRDDAAALFSFVDSVCELCDERVDSPAYPEASRKFFSYIHRLGRATKRFLNGFPEKAPKDDRLYVFYRGRLEAIRNGWFEFHEFIKPAIDAETLRTPYSLLNALMRRFARIKGFEDTQFAVFHFNELNYLQVRVSEVRKTAEKLANNIPDAPPFPPALGMIGIPYSQSSSLFLNCLIPHEMGHFVFQKLLIREELLSSIEQQIETSINIQKSLESEDKILKEQDHSWNKDRLSAWSEEIFCDLFAVRLLGPCYSFAFLDLFGLTSLLSPSDKKGYILSKDACRFSRSHPADIFRLQYQVRYLIKLGWWPHIVKIKSHYTDLLNAMFNIDQNPDRAIFHFPAAEKPFSELTVSAFCTFAEQLISIVEKVVGDLDAGVKGYENHGSLIEEYLQLAVVPSTVFDGSAHWYPEIVTLLNAFTKFRLESLDVLMNRIEHQKPRLVAHRNRWMKRLELLMAKAIEDYQLLVGEKGAIEDGRSFKRAHLG